MTGLLQNKVAIDVKEGGGSLNALTGLRFIAAYSVVLHHIKNKVPDLDLGLALPFGDGAVSFFFVLSGFILAHVYLGQMHSFKDIRVFWFKRWARIWPLHLVCLLLWVAVFWGPNNLSTGLKTNWPKLIANLCLVQTWIPSYQWGFSFNGVSWSISNEMFFYAVFPLLLFLPRKLLFLFVPVWFVALGVILQNNWSAFTESLDNPTVVVHLNPVYRVGEFMIGVVTRRLFQVRDWSVGRPKFFASFIWEVMVIGLFFASWYYLLGYHRQHVYKTTFPEFAPLVDWLRFFGFAPVFAFLIYVFSRSQGPFAWLLSRPLSVYLGEISFSLYMVHSILISVTESLFFNSGTPSPWLVVVAISSFSILASIVLYHLVEMPARSGLMKIYSGNWLAAFQSIMNPRWDAIGTRVFACCLVGSVISGSYILQFKKSQDFIAKSIVSQPATGDQPIPLVEYEGTAKLLSYEMSRREDQALVFDLTWQTFDNSASNFFVMICDESGKFLRNATVDVPPNTRKASEWKQQIVVASEELESAKKINFGFFQQGKGPVSAKVHSAKHLAFNKNRFLISLDE